MTSEFFTRNDAVNFKGHQSYFKRRGAAMDAIEDLDAFMKLCICSREQVLEEMVISAAESTPTEPVEVARFREEARRFIDHLLYNVECPEMLGNRPYMRGYATALEVMDEWLRTN